MSNILELSGLFVCLGDLLSFSVHEGTEKKCWVAFLMRGRGGGQYLRLHYVALLGAVVLKKKSRNTVGDGKTA